MTKHLSSWDIGFDPGVPAKYALARSYNARELPSYILEYQQDSVYISSLNERT